MTTFEGLILLAAIVVVIIITNGVTLIVRKLNKIIRWQKSIWNELRSIRVNVASTAEYTQNHIAPDAETLYFIAGMLVEIGKWVEKKRKNKED